MRKSDVCIAKDRIAHCGKIWIKDTTLNYRQSSGVEFRGRYVDVIEYKKLLQSRVLKNRLLNKSEDTKNE